VTYFLSGHGLGFQHKNFHKNQLSLIRYCAETLFSWGGKRLYYPLCLWVTILCVKTLIDNSYLGFILSAFYVSVGLFVYVYICILYELIGRNE